MKKCILFTFLFFAIIANSQNNRTIDWGTDLDFIKVELPKNHYNFYKLKSEKDFFRGIEQISLEKDKLSDFGIAIKLQQLVASFGDSHTMIGLQPLFDRNKLLPLGLYWFSDGLHVIQTTKENQEILGQKLLKINKIPIQTIVDSLCSLETIDNDAIIKKNVPGLIGSIQLLDYFNHIDTGHIELQLENQKGESIDYVIKPTMMDRNNRVRLMQDSLPLCYQNGGAYFIDHIVKKDNVYYIQYNVCYSRETPAPGFRGDTTKLLSFGDFQKKVIETINANNFSKIIFDLRYNTGGSSPQGTRLVSELASMKNVNQKGKLYVILGRKTFSSAIINAMDFKSLTKAIFVGEETSGKPEHFGEVKFFKLPCSGLAVQYSTKYFGHGYEDLKTLTPDYIIEESFKDYKEGRDPVYNWIINQ